LIVTSEVECIVLEVFVTDNCHFTR